MRLAAEAPLWLALIFALLLVAAAVEDAARLRISNVICILILGGAFVAIAVTGPVGALWQNIVVFGVSERGEVIRARFNCDPLKIRIGHVGVGLDHSDMIKEEFVAAGRTHHAFFE